MKRISTYVIAAVMALAFTGMNQEAQAQSEEGEVVISAGVGWGVLHGLIVGIGEASENAGVNNFSSVPPIFAHLDYGVTENFSLGGAFTTASYSWEDVWTSVDSSSVTTVENVKIDVRRTNLAVRPLFHFGNGETLDLYAGPRVGVTIWSAKDDGTISTLDDQDYTGINSASTFAVQALFGMRAYFTDNIGANFEVGLGTAPYFVAFGVTGRF